MNRAPTADLAWVKWVGTGPSGTLGLIWIEKLFPRAFPDDEETEETPAPIARRAPIRVQLRPISVAPGETASIYLFCSQSETGPFTTSEIQQMFVNGAMLEETFYWQAGMTEWRNAKELRLEAINLV